MAYNGGGTLTKEIYERLEGSMYCVGGKSRQGRDDKGRWMGVSQTTVVQTVNRWAAAHLLRRGER